MAAVRPWPRSVWAWWPEVGRWQPQHGRPRRTVRVAVSTEGVSPHEAFDYWRSIAYYHFDADRHPPGGRLRFQARGEALMTPGGDLVLYRSSAVGGKRTSQQIRTDGGDTFAFGLVLTGLRRHRDERDGVTVARPGEFFCYDATRVARVQWDDHRGMHLSLPLERVYGAVGKALPPAHELIQRIRYANLAPFLRSQLGLLARQYHSLALAERSAMVQVAIDLLLTALRETFGGDQERQQADLNAYFVAATRMIHDRLDDPNLAPKSLAHALNLSRSTLYRAFHERGMTVAGYIREARLQAAKRLIEAGPPTLSIAAVAQACGFADPHHFRRLFRERFAMKPSEARDARGQAPAEPGESWAAGPSGRLARSAARETNLTPS